MLIFDQVLGRDILLRFWPVIVLRLLLHVDNRFSGLWMLLALSWSRWLLHASRWARLQAEWGEFEDLGRSWGVLVACHESSVISESGNDGVVSSWYVSSENQVQERTENASFTYSWVDWKDWRGLHIEFYLGVAICEIGFKQQVIGCGERTLELVKDAVMPHTVKYLLNVKKKKQPYTVSSLLCFLVSWWQSCGIDAWLTGFHGSRIDVLGSFRWYQHPFEFFCGEVFRKFWT